MVTLLANRHTVGPAVISALPERLDHDEVTDSPSAQQQNGSSMTWTPSIIQDCDELSF
jgi:hypothetical protein